MTKVYVYLLVADLPGLIPGSHKNKGLGIQFLKHAERCIALIYIIDISLDEPWIHLETLNYELLKFSSSLSKRPKLIVANKIDLLQTNDNLKLLKEKTSLPIVPVSAKLGTNVKELLIKIRIMYDQNTDEHT